MVCKGAHVENMSKGLCKSFRRRTYSQFPFPLPTSPQTMTIYRSPTPDVKIPNVSLFTFLFEGKIDKEIPGATPIFIDADTRHRFTRSEFKAASLSLGWGLRNVFAKKLGGVKVTKGDTVMIFSPNCLAWPLALFASIAAGFRTTLSDPLLTSEELAPRWEDSRAKVIFTDRALMPVVVEMLEKSGVSKEEARKRIVIMGVGDKDATTNGFIHMDDLRGGKGRGAAERFDGKSSNETVFLCYSSGTTGKSKGIEVSLFFFVNQFEAAFRLHDSLHTETSLRTASCSNKSSLLLR